MPLSEFREAQKTVDKSWQCGMARLELTAEQQADLDEALEDRTIGPSAIAYVLKSWGKPASDAIIRKHRAGVCACPRKEA